MKFQRSGDTISRVIHEVVDAMMGRGHGGQGLASRLLRPRDPLFTAIPEKILNDERYHVFKVWLSIFSFYCDSIQLCAGNLAMATFLCLSVVAGCDWLHRWHTCHNMYTLSGANAV